MNYSKSSSSEDPSANIMFGKNLLHTLITVTELHAFPASATEKHSSLDMTAALKFLNRTAFTDKPSHKISSIMTL
jgi:hypothetical protein